ncbi:MAG: Mini-ribonuclease 3 [Clostridiales Family XIII bacterium]|jgi:ribonuclease-3 family protein|nr:Mini-ribonuclease 3 [Clostridiales Family XIII bacterium]
MRDDLTSENTTVLAFIGDAAYELRIREHVILSGISHGDRLHFAAIKYVRASAQAMVMKAIFDELPEDEQWLVKRARNKKISTKPKNATPVDYKLATAFEALLGYYCISKQDEKLAAVVARAVELIDGVSKPHRNA